jgi:hypothetical protein
LTRNPLNNKEIAGQARNDESAEPKSALLVLSEAEVSASSAFFLDSLYSQETPTALTILTIQLVIRITIEYELKSTSYFSETQFEKQKMSRLAFFNKKKGGGNAYWY